MEDKLCSDQMGNMEQLVERAFWEALAHGEGVNSSWQPGTEPTEANFVVEDLPHARINYPWNPTAPEAEAFFTDSESLSIWDGWQDVEIRDRAHSFFNNVDQLWATSLQATLLERFAARVPQNWITAIAQQTQQVVADVQQTMSDASAVLSEQLVQCVREVVPGLAEEDFYILARPLAVSMRSADDSINAAIAQVPQVEWDQLSDVQRARLSLAVARYAIDQLHSSQDA